MIISGMIAVKAALANGVRDISKIYISDKAKRGDRNYILKIANNKNIAYEIKDDQSLKAEYGQCGKAVGIVGKRYNDAFNNLLKSEIIFYLDGIEDPYNFAYSIRTLYAFGYDKIMINYRDYGDSEATILRSSAGAYDRITLYNSNDPYNDLLNIKNADYFLLALNRGEEAESIFTYNYPDKICLLIGGEKRGIKKDILKLCTNSLYIPYGSDFLNALPSVSAVSILASTVFERKNYDHIFTK